MKILVLSFILLALNLRAQTAGQARAKDRTTLVSVGAQSGLSYYTSEFRSAGAMFPDFTPLKTQNLAIEHEFLNRVFFGLKLQHCAYPHAADSATKRKAYDASYDVAGTVNFICIQNNKFGLLSGAETGISMLEYSSENDAMNRAGGTGLYFDLHLKPTYYFSDNVGAYLYFGYTYYSYNNIKFYYGNSTPPDVLKMQLKGFNCGAGLIIRSGTKEPGKIGQ